MAIERFFLRIVAGIAKRQAGLKLVTDVKSYYASIDQLLLLDQLAIYIKDRRVLNLLCQYLKRTSERGGNFWEFNKAFPWAVR